MDIILYVLIGLLSIACVGLVVSLTGGKKREAELRSRAESAENTLNYITQSYNNLEAASKLAEQSFREQADSKNVQITALSSDLARAQSQVETLTEQASRDKEELEKLQASFRLEFRNLANEILEEKSTLFQKSNHQALDLLLKPFKDNISDFKERVEKIYADENQQRGALKNEIKNLMDLNKRITEETTNLTKALRGNSKVQGDWGEMILETILENSNLVHGIHYLTQENIKDEQGANQRPDVILNLPDRKQIVVDSKVSLTAFVNHVEAEDEAQRKRYMDEHLASVRKHVNELGSKRYQSALNSPDFVIMFVPNEPAFLAALQADPTIWGDAYNKKVIISSPTNLFALLKIVDDLWKRDKQSKNALQIAEDGGKLYDKFVGFVSTLEAVGKGIQNASDSYDKAFKQLYEGSGNLVRRAENLRKLGIKTSRQLSENLTAKADGEDLDLNPADYDTEDTLDSSDSSTENDGDTSL